MESPAETPGNGCSLWKCLLLTASMLSCWIQPTLAQHAGVTVVPSPPYGTVGGNVTLTIQGFSEQVLSYNWYRETTEDTKNIGSYSNHSLQTPTDTRERVLPNGTLLIPNLTLSDAGLYIVKIVNSQGLACTEGRRELSVYEKLVKPNITINNSSIRENDTLVLTCSTENKGANVLWFYNNQPLSLNETMNLPKNNKMLIMSVKREHTGSYQCVTCNPISANRSDALNLSVNYGPDHIKVLLSPESGKVQFNAPLTLECQAQSYPPAQYEWHINGTSRPIYSESTYNIIHASWENSGNYTCWARNNVTKLSISKHITIKVDAVHIHPWHSGKVTGIVIGVLAGVAFTGAAIYFLFFRKTGKGSDYHLTHNESSAPNHSQAYLGNSPNTDEDVSYALVNFRAQETPVMAQSQPPTETIYSELKLN